MKPFRHRSKTVRDRFVTSRSKRSISVITVMEGMGQTGDGNVSKMKESLYLGGVAELVSMPKVSGSNLREAQKVFKNHFEYFSTLSQVCIKHDELGRLVAGLTAKL